MSAMTVNVAGLVLIGLIVWWFWLSRPVARRVDSAITVVVEDGVYSPARIEVAKGRPVILRFLRKDPSPCAAKVIFGELGVSADLPIGEEREVRLEPPRSGEYGFNCEMNMYRGSLLVK
jgi:plastocyanin domain-containing protein